MNFFLICLTLYIFISLSKCHIPRELVTLENKDIQVPDNNDSSYASFTILVGAASSECVYYQPKKTKFEVDYQVLRGGELDIMLKIFDPNDVVVSLQTLPKEDNTESISVPLDKVGQAYTICLENVHSRWQTKKVYVMIDADITLFPNNQNKMTKIEVSLNNIDRSLVEMSHQQMRKRSTEAIDRDLMERNFIYVTYWSLLQIVAMISMSLLQLMLIRALFEPRHFTSGLWKRLSVLSNGLV